MAGIAFEFEAFGLGVELPQFRGIGAALFEAFRQPLALLFQCPCAVEFFHGGPAHVALGVERPVGRDEDHRSVRGEVDRQLHRERLVALHAVEIPAGAEGVKCRLKPVLRIFPIYGKCLPEIAFGGERPADDSLAVREFGDIPTLLDRFPCADQFRITDRLPFDGIEFRLRVDERFVAAFLDEMLVFCHDPANFFRGRFGEALQEEYRVGIKGLARLDGVKARTKNVVDVQRPEGERDEHPSVEDVQLGRNRFLAPEGMVAPQVGLRIFPAVVGEGVELFEILFEGGGHDGEGSQRLGTIQSLGLR